MEKTYTIKNLDCAHCAGKIENLISEMQGIESAVLNFPLKKLTVKGDIDGDTLMLMNELARSIEAETEIVPFVKAVTERTYTVKNIDCAHCAGKIENLISEMQGIESAVLNFPLKKLTVKGDIDGDTLMLMNELARSIEPEVEIILSEEQETESAESVEKDDDMKKDIAVLSVGVVLFAVSLVLHHMEIGVSVIFFVISYLVLGFGVLKKAVKNIMSGNFFDENTLMTVATIGAFILGEYAEGVGIVLFFNIGEIFEHYAVNKSRKAITSIAGMKSDTAEVLRGGEFVTVPAENIKIGDTLRVKAGERVPADGVIETGEPEIDTSAINGEPVPIVLEKGGEVFSGYINLSGTFTMTANATVDDSMLSKIAEAVENASAGKPKIDRFITKFSKVYTPVVLLCALLTAVLGSLITHNYSKWIYSALTFLVISCPCALVLSVPLAYFSGIGAGSKIGVLFKGGDSLENLGKVKAVAFDKTGTLTDGSFSVTEIECAESISEKDLIKICGSCEQGSNHPTAKSVVRYCEEKNINLTQPESVREYAGRGVSAVLDGREILCGNIRLMSENNIEVPKSGKSGSEIYIAVDKKFQGRIIISDRVKKTSAKAIRELKSMGISTAMLTGDSQENAEIANKIILADEVHGGLMPEDKLKFIEKIRAEKGAVMFVGDGINDGPVLAGADFGGAVQTGSDLALEASDAVFMNTEPETFVKAKRIADRTAKIARQNIVFALAVKLFVLVLGVVGLPNIWLAVFADSGTAMLLVLNSIRALSTKKL